MRIIKLGKYEVFEVKVSDEDYEYLSKWKWNYKKSTRKFGYAVYARRGGGRKNSGKGKVNRTILMHDVVLIECMGKPRPSPMHTGDHLDNDTLNCQRDNLDWATKSEQVKNQRRWKKQDASLSGTTGRSEGDHRQESG